MTRKEAERHTAQMVILFGRVRRYLGARPRESLEEVARRAIKTTPPWSPAQDVAKVILRAVSVDPKLLQADPGDPFPVIELAASLARPKLVPRMDR